MRTKAKLFIVDDEKMALDYFISMVHKASPDYDVVGVAYNGEEAMEEIMKTEPDIVFADISMPIMDGLRMAEKLSVIKSEIKVILLTSYRDFDYAKKGLSLGVSSYLLKNELTVDVLCEEIERVMEESKSSKIRNRTYKEHNIRMFLEQQANLSEDLIYKNKPLRRFSVVLFFKKTAIRLEPKEETLMRVELDACEKLLLPEGIVCRDMIEVSPNCWCAVLFIEPNVAESEAALKRAAFIIGDELQRQQVDYGCLIAKAENRFLELPRLYQKCRRLKNYIFAQPSEKRLFTVNEVEESISQPCNLVKCRDEFTASISKDYKDTVLFDKFKRWLTAGRYALNKYDYERELKLIYAEMERLVLQKNLDVHLLDISKVYWSAEEAERCLINCMMNIMEQIRERDKTNCPQTIQAAMGYISSHYMKDISLLDIALAVGLSEGHLRKSFKKETGITLGVYLTDYRIEQAKALMQGGETRIKEICENTGFASSQYFSYVFKGREGVSPSEYIKSIHRGEQG